LPSNAQNGSATTRLRDICEIGSDFELVDDRYLIPANSQALPWEDSADIIYVESGRQALAIVETELRRLGHTQIHVPSYLCDSMVDPFHRHGWVLAQLPLDDDLVVRPEELLARVTNGVLLHNPYFGRQDSPAMLDALETIRRRGVVVVVDETHRVFSGPSPVADIRVASVRKVLPVYDGGYVAGLPAQLRPSLDTVPSGAAAFRQLAMRAKSDALSSGDGSKTHLELFAKAAEATEVGTQPVRMSEDSYSLLYRLDMEMIRAAREKNSIALTQALGENRRFRVINPPAADLLPSHLVLDTDDVPGLKQRLNAQQIYCPIHWPPSEVLPQLETWPGRYISLPVDHRYGEPDMLRMAACIKTFFSQSSQRPTP
jgi:hypothetical protein